MADYEQMASQNAFRQSVGKTPMPRSDPRGSHPEDAPEPLRQSVDQLHGELEKIPTPQPDPRGYDSGSMMRNFGKYPASFPEKAAALAGAIRQIWYGAKD